MLLSDWPAARSSRMNSTARRVPRITGLPARILGSTTMRSDGGIDIVYRARGRLGSCCRPAVVLVAQATRPTKPVQQKAYLAGRQSDVYEVATPDKLGPLLRGTAV